MFGKYLNPVEDVATWKRTGQLLLPTLLAGTDSYVSQNASWMWDHDVFLFLLPTEEEKVYSFGCVAVQRAELDAPKRFVFVGSGSAKAPAEAAKKALDLSRMQRYDASETRLRWVTKMMRKCPTVSLTDVLHLPPYEEER